MYRVLRPIYKLNYRLFKNKHKETPWIAQEAILFLQKELDKTMKVLEYGSGFSTLFYARTAGHVVSVEHNKEWYDLISAEFAKRNADNINYVYIPRNNPETFSDAELKNKFPELKDFETSRHYGDYFNFINTFPDEEFDFIMIDGRARVESFFSALPKLKKGGMIMLDNSERKRYIPIHQKMEKHKKLFFTTGLTDTVVWYK